MTMNKMILCQGKIVTLLTQVAYNGSVVKQCFLFDLFIEQWRCQRQAGSLLSTFSVAI